MNEEEKAALMRTAEVMGEVTRVLSTLTDAQKAAHKAMRDFIQVHGNPKARSARKPIAGEEMLLIDTLKPRLSLLGLYPWLVTWVPPLILTYRGARTGALVSTTLRV